MNRKEGVSPGRGERKKTGRGREGQGKDTGNGREFSPQMFRPNVVCESSIYYTDLYSPACDSNNRQETEYTENKNNKQNTTPQIQATNRLHVHYLFLVT